MLTHNEILEMLSDIINDADERGDIETGDNAFMIIQTLRNEWRMDDND